MGVYEGAEQALTSRWVLERLQANAAVLDALVINGTPVGNLSARLFEDSAPPDTPYPFIIFQCQVPPRDVRGVGTTRVMVDTMYVVKAVAQVPTNDALAPIARVIDLSLTTSVGGIVEDGHIFTCIREEQFSLNEIENGKQFRHFGGLYKIQAQG